MTQKMRTMLLMLGAVIACVAAGAPSAAGQTGGKITFNSTRDGNFEIYVMNSDGSNQTRLTNNTVTDEDPTFSPDGSRIAFVSRREGRLARLARVFESSLAGVGRSGLSIDEPAAALKRK